MSAQELVKQLQARGLLQSREATEAMLSVPREYFVDPQTVEMAYVDRPLPLGISGQTISAPHMVAIMLDALDLSPGQNVLEIGAGSGYNAALMAHILKQGETEARPVVTSIERLSELTTFATNNIHKAGYENWVKIVFGDGSLGYPEKLDAPVYDRITVTAGASRVPYYLKRQLKENGIMLIPVGERHSLRLITITRQGNDFIEHVGTGCSFVPLLEGTIKK